MQGQDGAYRSNNHPDGLHTGKTGAETGDFFPDVTRSWYDTVAIQLFNYALSIEDYVSFSTMRWLVGVWVLVVAALVFVVRSDVVSKYFTDRQRKKFATEHPRAHHSRRRLMERYVQKGLNDDIFFTSIDEKETAQLRLTNPFNIQSAPAGGGGGAAGAMQMLANAAASSNAAAAAERRLFVSVGSDSEASPYAHEDCERMADLFGSKLGYKTVHFSNKSTQPTSGNLATMAKQLQLCGRSWDHVVVFVAAKFRVCEIDRSYLTSALKKKARGQGRLESSKAEEAKDSSKFPFFFLEFLSDQTAPENPKNWIDLHMLTQRIIEGATHNTDNPYTEFSLILDGSYRSELAQMLPVSEQEKATTTSAALQTADLSKLIWEAGLSRHVPVCVLGSERFVVPSATVGKKPKHLGSVMVRRLVDGVNGNTTATPSNATAVAASASPNGECNEEDGDEEQNPEQEQQDPPVVLIPVPDPDEPAIAFPTASGSTDSGIYHQGVATMETLYHHICAAWPQDSPAALPFWQSPLHEAPVLTVQEALMPRLCLQSPLESWKCGLPHIPSLNKIRQLIVTCAVSEELQFRTSSVIAVSGSGPDGSGRRSGLGVTSFLRELAHTGHMIRRDCVYLDLSLYQTRTSTSSFEPNFVKLITDLGRVMVTLEHPLTSVAAAETFAMRVLSAVKVVLILDHLTETMLISSPLGRFLEFLARRGEADSVPKKLCVLVAPVSACPLDNIPQTAAFALPPLPECNFNPAGFLSGHYLSTVSSASSVPAKTLDSLTEDEGMNLWMWKLARGVVDQGEELAVSKDGVLAQVVQAWTNDEIALLRHLFLLSSDEPEFSALRGPTGHISMGAAVAQSVGAKFDTMWDAVPAVRRLVISGVLYLSPMIHSFSAKEVRGHNLHINPEVLNSARASGALLEEDARLPDMLQEVLKVYVSRAGARLTRNVYDGFYFPGIVQLVTAVGSEAVERILPSSGLLEYDATHSQQPTPLYRFLSECVRVRGIEGTLQAFLSVPKTAGGEAEKQHALLQAVPEVCFRALEKHSRGIKVQPNEFFQVIFNALAVEEACGGETSNSVKSAGNNFGGIFPRDWSPSCHSLDYLPEVSAQFRRNLLSHNKGLRYFCPAVFPQEVPLPNDFYSDFKPTSAVSACLTETTTLSHYDPGQREQTTQGSVPNMYRTIVGFHDGSIGAFDLSGIGRSDSVTGGAQLSKLSQAHGAKVDIIMKYGEEVTSGQGNCQIVTAARSIHEIFVWAPDLSSCEKVPQLTKPPSKKGRYNDDESEEEDEDEEDEAERREVNRRGGSDEVNVADIKRKFYLHLVPRSLDDDTVSMYRRSAGDDEVRRHEDSQRPRGPSTMPPVPPTEVAVVSIGDLTASGQDSNKQRKHDTVAESVKYYNRLSCNPVDPVSGVLTISTPDDASSFTCGSIADVGIKALQTPKSKKGDDEDSAAELGEPGVITAHPRIVLGTSEGEINVYRIVALPRYSALP